MPFGGWIYHNKSRKEPNLEKFIIKQKRVGRERVSG